MLSRIWTISLRPTRIVSVPSPRPLNSTPNAPNITRAMSHINLSRSNISPILSAKILSQLIRIGLFAMTVSKTSRISPSNGEKARSSNKDKVSSKSRKLLFIWRTPSLPLRKNESTISPKRFFVLLKSNWPIVCMDRSPISSMVLFNPAYVLAI